MAVNVSTDFESLVQDALDHLFDPAGLFHNPLTEAIAPGSVGVHRGQALHQVIRDAITWLKPSPDAPLHSPAWRSYHYLSLRYVEMLTLDQVARELGVSPRQCRRDHHEALSTLCSILRGHFRVDNQTREADAGGEVPRAIAASRLATDELLGLEIGKMGASSATGATDLGALIDGVASTLAILATQKNVDLRLDVHGSDVRVVIDRTVLRQLLLELLLFALDLASNGLVSVTVSGSADIARLEVVARPSETRSSGWARERARDDIRLAVCRQLADLQGVTIEVEAEDDLVKATLSLPSDRPPVVLVVDDNADVVHLFRHYLEGIYEVVEARNGEQALSLARQTRPRIITLDVMMPTQDGWEVLQTIKQDPATEGIPVIVCSVLRERELALSLGAADYLAKPITGHQLVTALHRLRLAS